MGSVSWNWKRLKDESLYSSMSYETNNDFPSEKDAKNTLNAYFKELECERCGYKNLNGDNIIVELTKVALCHEVKKKGFFGGEKLVEEHWKTVYRVGSIIFPQAHYLVVAVIINALNASIEWGLWDSLGSGLPILQEAVDMTFWQFLVNYFSPFYFVMRCFWLCNGFIFWMVSTSVFHGWGWSPSAAKNGAIIVGLIFAWNALRPWKIGPSYNDINNKINNLK